MEKSVFFNNNGGKGKCRPISHINGESGVEMLKEIFPKEWVVREYSPDYGIDLDVELFEKIDEKKYKTLGEHIFVQVKGTDNIVKKEINVYSCMNVEKEICVNKSDLSKMLVVQYSIDTDLLSTVEQMGSAVPVLLCVVDLKDKEAFFVCLNDYIEKILIPQNPVYYEQDSVTINVPIRNKVNSEEGRYIIESYGKRAKLYAFFNKVNYQLKELDYSDDAMLEQITEHFLKIICRLDVWSATKYFPALEMVKEEIDYYLENGNTKMGDMTIRNMIERGEDVDSEIWEGTYCLGEQSFRRINKVQAIHTLWKQMSNVSGIFEEISKEAFLPSKFAIDISY